MRYFFRLTAAGPAFFVSAWILMIFASNVGPCEPSQDSSPRLARSADCLSSIETVAGFLFNVDVGRVSPFRPERLGGLTG
jgi:hypothetical protein